MDNEMIQLAIDNRSITHYGIYSDISTALENFSVEQLFRYYLDVIMKGHNVCIRDYLENQIIYSIISSSP